MIRTILNNVVYGLTIASLGFCNNDVQAVDNTNSAFEYREIYLPEGTGKNARSLGLNSVDSDWGLWGHNLMDVLPEKPSQTIYAKSGGQSVRDQFCFASNHLFEYIETYIVKNYGEDDTNRFAILPNDNSIVCTCSECKKLGNTKTDASPAVFSLIKRLAERFPNHLFFASYYQTTRSLPEEQLPTNVGVLISAMEYPLSTATTLQEQKFEELLTTWGQKTDHVYVWDYINNFDDYFTPFPVFEVMQRRLLMYEKAGVKGVFLNGSGTDYSTMSNLKTRVLAELTKDPHTDWREYLKSLCHQLYPITGDIISQFMLSQEDYVLQTGKILPIYDGVTMALSTYLPEDDFISFYEKLKSLRTQTKGDEKDDINVLCNALTLTRLELKRLRSDLSGCKTLLNELTDLKRDGVEVYSESCWTIESYVNDYNFMYDHAKSTRNLLKGVKLTPLTALDPEYSDISILTDGLVGLPTNYHCGQMQSSADPSLRIAIPHVDGMRHLRVCLTRNQIYHIGLPLKIRLDIGGVSVGTVEPQKLTNHLGHVFAEFDVPASSTGTLVLTLVRNPESRTMAIDEIEGF